MPPFLPPPPVSHSIVSPWAPAMPDWEAKQPGFLDRFTADMVGTVKGIPSGLLELGRAGWHDVGQLGADEGSYRLPQLGQGMWDSFSQESFIPALLGGSPGEALRRASERPFSAMLDASLVVPGYGAALKGGSTIGKVGMRMGLGGENLARRTLELRGYRELAQPLTPMQRMAPSQLGSLMAFKPKGMGGPLDFEMVPTGGMARPGVPTFTPEWQGADMLPRSEYLRAGGDMELLPDGSQWLRRTHRMLLPSQRPHNRDVPDELAMQDEWVDGMQSGIALPRSRNELSARAGDAVAGAAQKYLPESIGFLSNTNRYARKLFRGVMSQRNATMDEASIKHVRMKGAVVAQLAKDLGVDEAIAEQALGDATLLHAGGHGNAPDPQASALAGVEGLDPEANWIDQLNDDDLDQPVIDFEDRTGIIVRPTMKAPVKGAHPHRYARRYATMRDYLEALAPQGRGGPDDVRGAYQAYRVPPATLERMRLHDLAVRDYGETIETLLRQYDTTPSLRDTIQIKFVDRDANRTEHIYSMRNDIRSIEGFVQALERGDADIRITRRDNGRRVDLAKFLTPRSAETNMADAMTKGVDRFAAPWIAQDNVHGMLGKIPNVVSSSRQPLAMHPDALRPQFHARQRVDQLLAALLTPGRRRTNLRKLIRGAKATDTPRATETGMKDLVDLLDRVDQILENGWDDRSATLPHRLSKQVDEAIAFAKGIAGKTEAAQLKAMRGSDHRLLRLLAQGYEELQLTLDAQDLTLVLPKTFAARVLAKVGPDGMGDIDYATLLRKGKNTTGLHVSERVGAAFEAIVGRRLEPHVLAMSTSRSPLDREILTLSDQSIRSTELLEAFAGKGGARSVRDDVPTNHRMREALIGALFGSGSKHGLLQLVESAAGSGRMIDDLLDGMVPDPAGRRDYGAVLKQSALGKALKDAGVATDDDLTSLASAINTLVHDAAATDDLLESPFSARAFARHNEQDFEDRIGEVADIIRGLKEQGVDVHPDSPDLPSIIQQALDTRAFEWLGATNKTLTQAIEQVTRHGYIQRQLEQTAHRKLDLDVLEDEGVLKVLEDDDAITDSGLRMKVKQVAEDPVVGQVLKHEKLREYLEYLRGTVLADTERAAREWNVDNPVYRNDHFTRTAQRMADLMGGIREDGTHDGFYFPIRTPKKVEEGDRPGKRVQKQHTIGHRDDVGMGRGNPVEKLVRGEFRTDPDVFLDNWLFNLGHEYQSRLADGIEGASMWWNLERVQEAEKEGLIGWSSEYQNKGRKPLYIAVKLDDPDAQMVLNLNEAVKQHARALEAEDRMLEATHWRRVLREAGGQEFEKLRRGMGAREAYGKRKEFEATNEGRDPKVLVMNTEFYEAMMRETANAIGGIRAFAKKSGNVWKLMVLHARFPAWLRNNLIGSNLMLMASGGLLDYGPSLMNVSKKFGPVGPSEMRWRDELIEKLPRVATGTGSAHLMRMRQGDLPGEGNRMVQGTYKLAAWASDLNAKIADEPYRLARADQILTRMAGQLKGQMDAEGLPYDEWTVKRSLLEDPDVRTHITEEVMGDMVDFSNLGKFERDYIASLFPFWAWMKGSMKATGRRISDDPEAVWGIAQVGDLGAEATTEQQGAAIPEFTRSWVLPWGKDGTAINTSGMIPWEQPMDLLAMGLGAIPGGMSYRQYGTENMLSNTHPFFVGGIEALTGRDAFFGTPLENEGWGTTFLKRQGDIPPLALLRNTFDPQVSARGTRERDPLTTWANYLGASYLDPKWGAVHARAVDEAQERYQNPGVIPRLAEVMS